MTRQLLAISLTLGTCALLGAARTAAADECGTGTLVEYEEWRGTMVLPHAMGARGDAAVIQWANERGNVTSVAADGTIGETHASPAITLGGYGSARTIAAGERSFLQVAIATDLRVHGSIIDADGVAHPAFPIAAANSSASFVRATWFRDAFVVTWTRAGGPSRWEILASRVSEDGVVLDAEPVVVGVAQVEYPPLAVAAAAGDVLYVAWNTAAGAADPYADNLVVARLSSELVAFDPQLLLLAQRASLLELVTVGKRAMLLAAGFEVGTHLVAVLDRNGLVASPRLQPGVSGRVTALLPDGDDGAVLVTSDDYGSDYFPRVDSPIRAHRIDADGRLDPDAFVELDGVAPVAAVVGGSLLVAYAADRTAGADLGHSRVLVRRVLLASGSAGNPTTVGENDLTIQVGTYCETMSCSSSTPSGLAMVGLVALFALRRSRRARRAVEPIVIAGGAAAFALVARTPVAAAEECGPNEVEVNYFVWNGAAIHSLETTTVGDRALVTWFDTGLRSAVLDRDGALIQTNELPTPGELIHDSEYGRVVSHYEVVGGAESALMVWVDESSQLRGLFLDERGSPVMDGLVPRTVTLGVTHAAEAGFEVLWTGASFLVAWTVDDGDDRWRIVGVRVNEQGELLDAEPVAFAPVEAEWEPAFRVSTVADVVWVIWSGEERYSNDPSPMRARRLSFELIPLDWDPFVIGDALPPVRIVATDGEHVVVFAVERDWLPPVVATLDREGPTGPATSLLEGSRMPEELFPVGNGSWLALVTTAAWYQAFPRPTGNSELYLLDTSGEVPTIDETQIFYGYHPEGTVVGNRYVVATMHDEEIGDWDGRSWLDVQSVALTSGATPSAPTLVAEQQLEETIEGYCIAEGACSTSTPGGFAPVLLVGVFLLVRVGRTRRASATATSARRTA